MNVEKCQKHLIIFFIFRSYYNKPCESSFELCKHVMEKTGENNPSIVDYMLSTIATGYTALHCAAEMGCLDVARLIVNRMNYDIFGLGEARAISDILQSCFT